jgi:hypothetical protein
LVKVGVGLEVGGTVIVEVEVRTGNGVSLLAVEHEGRRQARMMRMAEIA